MTVEWAGVVGGMASIAAGLGIHAVYAHFARTRWGAHGLDAVRAATVRLEPQPDWTKQDRTLHGVLWFAKRMGMVLLFCGVAVIVLSFHK